MSATCSSSPILSASSFLALLVRFGCFAQDELSDFDRQSEEFLQQISGTRRLRICPCDSLESVEQSSLAQTQTIKMLQRQTKCTGGSSSAEPLATCLRFSVAEQEV